MILNFGKYRGRKLDFVINQPDGVEHLNWYIKRLDNYINNANFEKYKQANLQYKMEIENILNKNAEKDIEVSVQDTEIENKVEKQEETNEKITSNISNDISIKEDIEVQEAVKKEEIQEPVNNIENEKLELNKDLINNTNDFDKLKLILEELLLSKLDVKFRKPYNINKHYRDYVCLRMTLKTYNEVMEERNVNQLKDICNSLI